MHVPNHLLSPDTAIIGGVATVALVAVAISKIAKNPSSKEKFTLAGVMGAFVFAAQMLNFAIGTAGFSGHLIGGILLAALLGKWLGFITLSAVITLQALLFADGGIMALGWNIINMAAISTLVVYPLIFKPLTKAGSSPLRMALVTLLSSLIAVELGAGAVVAESTLSGIVTLPAGSFMGTMLPTHLVIGLAEGLISALIVALVAWRNSPLLDISTPRAKALRIDYRQAILSFSLAALLIGGALSLFSSELPDGLEWSILQTGGEAAQLSTTEFHRTADSLQESIALAPDYEGDFTGLWATAGVLLLVWVGTSGSPKKERKA